MAGIGFELKKLFRRKGLFASLRAYGYAGIICTGPMLLGVLLQGGGCCSAAGRGTGRFCWHPARLFAKGCSVCGFLRSLSSAGLP